MTAAARDRDEAARATRRGQAPGRARARPQLSPSRPARPRHGAPTGPPSSAWTPHSPDGRSRTPPWPSTSSASPHDGLAPASIAQAAAAAAFLARIAGWPNPRGAMTADALRIVKRDHAERGRGRARPVGAEDVAAIVATARRDGRDRDAAIAGVLFQAALRRSEASALEWRDIEPAADIPGALRIRVRRSKTDQAGDETDIRLVKNGAADALAAIRSADADPPVPGCSAASTASPSAAASPPPPAPPASRG